MGLKKIFYLILIIVSTGLFVSGCKKNDYFLDTGLHKADYDGTIMEYLEQNPHHLFDSLCKVIRLAGMEDVFNNDAITFFAPADTTILSTIHELNMSLLVKGKDTITDLSQVSSEVWKKELSLYIYKGIHRLKDYPQLDPAAMQAYGGQYYQSFNGKVLNIGVVFSDVNGVKYAGYRQLCLGYYPGETPPDFIPYLIPVASSDIHPKNGIVHVLQFTQTLHYTNTEGEEREDTFPVYFGFLPFDFISEAIAKGIDYSR